MMTGRVPSTVYRLTRPFLVEAFEQLTEPLEAQMVLLRPLRAGICGSDLKLYSGTRERSALAGKLPIALLHEAVAEVAGVGEGVGLTPGQRVVPSPNIPCTVARPGAGRPESQPEIRSAAQTKPHEATRRRFIKGPVGTAALKVGPYGTG